MKVDYENVQECWKHYEEYIERHKELYYSNVQVEDFVQWVEENLEQCPNCGNIVLKEEIENDSDFDGVCEQCRTDGYYE